jgi:HD-GYP domain-containing protein (c-di-GMP phosphodiesterase class II)
MPDHVPPQWQRRIAKLTAILEVAKALAAERRVEALFSRIVEEAARVAEADRCTLFVADRDKGELWSKVAQGTREIRMPLTAGIAGAVVSAGEPVRIDDAHADPRFNPEVDQATGYRTRSILAVPMWNTKGEIVGVLQALNRRDGTFTDEDQELLGALAGPAASALENAILNEEVERLFEGFVQASVLAIEQRDPTTAGHSGRVARLTIQLAQAVEKSPPAGAALRFTAGDLQQLRYAALLHDFGKVGVRENVLIKADKLYPHQLALVRARFDVGRLALENQALRARLAGSEEAAAALSARASELEGLWEVVLAANRPNVLPEGAPERLVAAAAVRVPGPSGGERPLLQPEELASLQIPRGSLSEAERREIESHVSHTWRFLSQIPWTRTLRRVPEIAYAHHEKLDGHGYPRGVQADAIPVEARMMTIADVYDALTASDRPYKKALPAEKALAILDADARQGQIDAGLLGVFVGAGLWRGEAPT